MRRHTFTGLEELVVLVDWVPPSHSWTGKILLAGHTSTKSFPSDSLTRWKLTQAPNTFLLI
jgi:hypothetical protein